MRTRTWKQILAVLAVSAAFWLVWRADGSAQSTAAGAGSAPSVRGEAWFYQRCSLCHMGRIVKDDKYEPMAPRLVGVLRNATPEREKAVRTFIQVGSQRMPGFRYNFTPAEFEELMAYLKTL